ncbi:MAG: HEAT repeat domain-containing protein [Planctomycetes bacterium]|nr:HEAT repeat domain-containing protein [Planctomycetota bacterium]
MTQLNLAQENIFLTCCAKHSVDDKKKNAWKPFQREGTPPMWCRDRLVDVQHILIEIEPNFETKSLSGFATLTVSAINEGTEFVELDAAEMKIAGVKVRGKPVHFHHDGQKLCVHFDNAPKPDKPFDITVEYATTPRRGAYFVGPDKAYPNKHREMWTQGQDEDSRYWFPCFDYPNEKATTEVIAKVPAGMISLSNGKLIKVTRKSDHELHHWKQAIPHVAYLVTLVIGEYTKIKDSWDGIEVSYYVPPGREEDGKRSFSRTPAIMKLFSEKTGVRYPYEKYSQITAVDFIFGGMENTTATTQTELTLHDARAHLDFKSDGLVAHELAHQWFGDYVTCRDWSHAWLNEGFATFMETVWCEAEEGWAETQYYFERDMKAYLDEDRGAYRRPIVTNVYREPLDLFDRHLYQKGALVLHHLRATIGERLFWKSINHYLNKHAKSSVITQDLINAIQDVTGRNMEWFFDQWVFSGGHPDFKISAKWDDKSNQLELNVVQKQAKDELTAIFRVETKVRFVWEGGEETRDFELSEVSHRYFIKLPKRPKMVLFDPGNTVLKTVELDYTEEMLIEQLKGDKDDVMSRVYAARELGKKGTIAATDALAEAVLKDAFWGVQAECAGALGKIHSDRALDALIAARAVKNPKARQAVAISLGQWRGDKAADALLPMLYRDDSYFVETAAASSLGKTRSPKAYDALMSALGKESYNDTIRSGVFNGLCELRDMRALKTVRDWTTYGRSWQARLSAIVALGRLAHDSTEDRDKLMARETLEPLLEQDFRTTLSAIAGLQALNDLKAIPALDRCAQASLDGRIKRRAQDAAQAIREGAGAPKELKELREDYDKIKKDYDDLKNRLIKLEGDKGGGKKHKAKAK